MIIKKRKHLNLSVESAMERIDDLSNNIHETYKIKIGYDNKLEKNSGVISDYPSGDFSIRINPNIRIEGNIFKKANELDFLNAIRMLYHETHHIIQNCEIYQSRQPNEDIIKMSIHKLASHENRNYYTKLNRYNNDLSEIDAEMNAIVDTYNYIKSKFKHADADSLICDLVNSKSDNPNIDYFIQGHYNSFDNIVDAFIDKYEQAKSAEVSQYIVWRLRPLDEINEKEDECIKYLQACVRENPEEEVLMTQFNSARSIIDRDLLIASITCHLHPEIEYDKIYPCLWCEDLSPENVFGRPLPEPPEGLIKPLSKEEIQRRIEKANEIYKIIQAEEAKIYDRNSYNEKHNIKLNESLLTDYQKDDESSYDI